MTLVDARTIADRLGLPQEAVRTIQRRGFLRRLDLGERDIRERLWRCHIAFVRDRDHRRAAAKDA